MSTYLGGSPKHGDSATCHKDGGAIEFFDGAWYHLAGTAPVNHNDVHPATPREAAEAAAAKSAEGRSGRVALAVEEWKRLQRAEAKVAARKRDLEQAMARFQPGDLSEYFKATEETE